MTKGSCLYVFTVSMATFRMAVEAGMVVKEEAEDGDSVNTSTSSPDKALLTRLLPVCHHGPMSQSPGPGL